MSVPLENNEEYLWKDQPCPSAVKAYWFFRRLAVKDLLVYHCGAGHNSLFFAEKGLGVLGYDESSQNVIEATKKAKIRNVKNLQYLSTLNEGELAFQGIFVANDFHVTTFSENEKFVEEMASMLKDGGYLALACLAQLGEEDDETSLLSDQDIAGFLSSHFTEVHTDLYTDIVGGKKKWFILAKKRERK
ncbi:class I SAM-dependent methyltransferase [Priestia endophytica]|jgi:SAM-dependent methyltransferase|uniref:class I SAM-dependent methyltransferase n=1 Tax=Priestia endophytica TaxID=135735 RepID=UPI002E1C5DEF|nr:class I SAM-dependent methyltransferase [Priestia endophytica]